MVFLLGGVAGLVIAMSLVVAVRRRQLRRAGTLLMPVDSTSSRQPVRDALNGDERLIAAAYQMVARLNVLAEQNDQFARDWNSAFTSAADHLTARIAGARMSGVQVGKVFGKARVPVPQGSDPAMVRLAFTLVVRDEVNRRIEAMASPGSFG